MKILVSVSAKSRKQYTKIVGAKPAVVPKESKAEIQMIRKKLKDSTKKINDQIKVLQLKKEALAKEATAKLKKLGFKKSKPGRTMLLK
jgi:hypothetical protein